MVALKLLTVMTLLIVVVSFLARLALNDSFMIKIFGVILLLFGFLIVFALGGSISEMSGDAMEIGGAFVVSGIILLLFI